MNAAAPYGGPVAIPVAAVTFAALACLILTILLRPHGRHREDRPPLRVRVLYAAARHMPRYWTWKEGRLCTTAASTASTMTSSTGRILTRARMAATTFRPRRSGLPAWGLPELRSAAPEGGPAPAPLPGRDASGYPYPPLDAERGYGASIPRERWVITPPPPADTVTDMPAVPDPPIARSWTPENTWAGAGQ